MYIRKRHQSIFFKSLFLWYVIRIDNNEENQNNNNTTYHLKLML